MRLFKTWAGGLFAYAVALIFLVADTQTASASSTRYWDRTVERGKQIEFQWLNFDERTCQDNGYPRFTVEKKPSLGRFRTVKRKFTQQNGKCKGQRFSVLLVYYVAGRKAGNDRTTYTIRGSNNIQINLDIDVK